MSGVGAFLKKYNVHIGLAALIVGIHWGWYKLQFVDALVTPEERERFSMLNKINKMKEKITPSAIEKPDAK